MHLKIKRTGLFVFVVVIVLAVATFAFVVTSSHNGRSHVTNSEQLYTCGMHPQVLQNKPGNCPICGMKLTPVRKQPGSSDISTKMSGSSASGDLKIHHYKSTMAAGEISQTPGKDSMGMDMVPVYADETSDSSIISIDPVTVQNMGIRTGAVIKGPLRRNIRTVGVVDFDETALSDVTTKFKGWIEKLYVDSTGQQAHKGQPLFEIYSPELVSAQTEFLLALDQAAGAQGAVSLKATARTKLKFFDISEEQIAELEKMRQVKKTLSVVAPRDGIVVEKMVVEGQMAEAGMKLYRLADLGIVWVMSQIYEQDLASVQPGQEAVVSLSYMPDRKFRGRVTYVYPTVDEKTRTARVRMEFHNPGYFLKPGMFATVELRVELEPSTLLVPDMAVLRSGEKNTVFVALPKGRFEPRTITLGSRSENNMYQVLSGLNEGESVVTSGQFMLDSESQLREAIQKMAAPQPATIDVDLNEGHPEKAVGAKIDSTTMEITYICPMPEHVSLQYPKPGKCPLCSMSLVPVSADLLARIQPGGHVEYYTCPMPEHNDLKLDKPGKCPKCGMTLIPVMRQPQSQPPTTSAPHGNLH